MPRICTLCIGLLAVLGGVSARACDVPVFRFALERWRPGMYRVLVYHHGTLSADQQTLCKSLEALSVDHEGLGNFSVERVVLDGKPDPDALAIFKAQPQPALPWMVVCYPDNDPSIPCAWAGPLTAANIGLVADSPVRKAVAQRLIGGDSAVWILLASDDAALDDAAAKTLQTELKRLESEIKLPEDPAARPEDKPLKLAFSVVRLTPGDPAEAALLGNLLRRDPEVAKRREPIAFPVFGRGRALCALVGEKMISRDNIEAAAKFLTGPCSCEVKDQNPGIDLLMVTDWGAAFAAAKPVESQLPTLGPPVPERSAPAVATPVAVAPAPTGTLYRNLLITLAAAAIVIVGIAVTLTLRDRRTEN
ncbi:MAG: hypothetical protein ACHRHE_07590 [Tepidisphaerales bacterium]